MNKSRVIIVEDDIALKQSLTDWLSSEYDVSNFESAELFLNALNDFEFEDGIPTCILLDFQMSGMTGVELQSTLKLMNNDYPIIFMSGNTQQADIVDAWRGGAIDFLLKPFSGNQVSHALTAVFDESTKIKLDKPRQTPEALIDIPISQREAEVLLLLGTGNRQVEVARQLNITLRTVKMHRANLKNKLGLNTLFDLTRYCDQHIASIKKLAKS
jgi:FixJ family two-component response regulator